MRGEGSEILRKPTASAAKKDALDHTAVPSYTRDHVKFVRTCIQAVQNAWMHVHAQVRCINIIVGYNILSTI